MVLASLSSGSEEDCINLVFHTKMTDKPIHQELFVEFSDIKRELSSFDTIFASPQWPHLYPSVKFYNTLEDTLEYGLRDHDLMEDSKVYLRSAHITSHKISLIDNISIGISKKKFLNILVNKPRGLSVLIQPQWQEEMNKKNKLHKRHKLCDTLLIENPEGIGGHKFTFKKDTLRSMILFYSQP